MLFRALLLGSLVIALPIAAPQAEACRTVHGRMSLTQGTPSVRTWVIGTKRMLGVVQEDESFDQLPGSIRRAWDKVPSSELWSHDLYGDFQVCAVTAERRGWMQFVRVEGAKNLQVRPSR